jgi:hypothetical protein
MRLPFSFSRLDYLHKTLYVLFFIIILNSLQAAEPDSLFRSDEIIKMELRADFTALQADRTGTPAAHIGELIYRTADKKTVKLSVEIMVRGNFRLDTSHCSFPPLFLNFKKKEVQNTLFDNQNKLKLVTPCQNEEDVFDEYLIYKLYNQISDQSMKVRLVKIQYYDTVLRERVFQKYSFFIEEKERVAERCNATERDIFVTPFDLNIESAIRISVFQYMIGNKDWFFTSRHNIIIMQPVDSTARPFAVPFDFDFSGFVNAAYTKPKGVTDDMLPSRRAYKGLCYTAEEFKVVFDYFHKQRPAFESLINNMILLPKYSRKQRIQYLDSFYSVIDDSELFKKEFLDVCQTKKDYNIPDK